MFTRDIIIYSGSIPASGSKESRPVSSSTFKQVAKWEMDPDDPTSVQFRIPSASIGTNNDRIAFYISGSGKVGIGTKDPETAFDIRDLAEDKSDESDDRKESIFKADRTAGNIDIKATALKNARTIGGISFDGTANINLPGVNTAGNQATTGNAATATSASYASTGSVLATARTIGGVSFDGSANINLPGVNTTGNQNTSGTSEFTNLVNSSTAAAKAGLQFTFDAAAGTLTITDKATRTTFTLRKD